MSEHTTFRPDGAFTVLRLDEPWTAFVLQLLDHLEAVLSGRRHPPGRPWRRYLLRRDALFPRAYAARSAAAAFRERHGEDMQRRVLAAVGTVRATVVHDQPLDPETVDAWVIALGNARRLYTVRGPSVVGHAITALQDAIVHGGMNAAACGRRSSSAQAQPEPDEPSFNDVPAAIATEPSRPSRTGRLWRPVLVGTLTVLVAVLAYGARIYGNPGDSDQVLVDRFAYWLGEPEPGEIVAFTAPAGWGEPSARLFGRVIATRGQAVDCCDPEHRVLVNGTPLHQPYQPDPTLEPVRRVVVPDGYVWIVDDAAHSGLIPNTAILGKARVVLFPLDHLQLVDHSTPQG